MASTYRGVVPHKTSGDYFSQPGSNYKPQTHQKTVGLYQQPGLEVPCGQQAPIISEERRNG